MFRDLVNKLSDPIFSFPIFILAYFLMIRFYRQVGTKKFAYRMLMVFLPLSVWFLADPNFNSVISTPDNTAIVLLLVSVAFFTWFSLYKAAENDKRIEAGLGPIEGTPKNREKVWCWPNLVYIELLAMIGFTAFLIVWAILIKAPLEESANPTWAPNPAKAPWYFLGLQEMLVYFDPWMAGVVLPGLIIVGLIAIPYIDKNPKGNGYYTFKERKFAISTFMFGWLVLWLYLIIIGVFFRGPNWTFYGPFEYWDVHKVVPSFNINLSELIWIKWLGSGMPRNLLLREIFGITLVLFYVFVIPPWFVRVTQKGRQLYNNLGSIRYYIFMFLLLTMASLPIKMFLRWLFSLKYVVYLPEWELNL